MIRREQNKDLKIKVKNKNNLFEKRSEKKSEEGKK